MNKRVKVYLAGPMTGLPDFNMPAFHAAADRLRHNGWDVVNPAEHFDGRTDLPRDMYLRADLAELVKCNAIAFLPGWQDSRGATMEYFVACELGMTALDAESGEPLDGMPDISVTITLPAGCQPPSCAEYPAVESILDEAKRITAADRQNDYGHPSDDFARTALMWTGILRGRLREGAEIAAGDVPLCMIAVKLARQANRYKRDNLVDIAGYARTAAMVVGQD